MNTYKFRATSFKQIGSFVKSCSKLGIKSLAVQPDKKISKESEVVIVCEAELGDILYNVLKSNKDLKTVYETISYIERYNGKKLR